MGWNSWDCYGAAVTEEQVRQNAAYMAAHLKEYGWEYVDSYGNFFIYRSTRPDYREMNTDLSVQAAALKAGRRSSTLTIFLDVFLLNQFFRSFLWKPSY